MKHASAIALIVVMLAAGTAAAQSEADIEAIDQYTAQLKGDLTKKRNSSLSQMIKLDRAQSKIFMGIVNDYDKAAKKIRKEVQSLRHDFIRTSSSLDAKTANDIAERAFSTSEARVALPREYFKRVSDEVSPMVAVQFIQLQSQFETMADAKVAAAMPLAGY